MPRYCITAARPKNATHHLKSEFKLWKSQDKDGRTSWSSEGWKRGAEIAALLDANHQVLTANRTSTGISTGKPVEMELRISKNETNYKIGDMPDE